MCLVPKHKDRLLGSINTHEKYMVKKKEWVHFVVIMGMAAVIIARSIVCVWSVWDR